jgi:hypothetical protein
MHWEATLRALMVLNSVAYLTSIKKNMRGMQAAGIFNLAGGYVKGAQFCRCKQYSTG